MNNMLSHGRFQIITGMIVGFALVFSMVALNFAEQRFRHDLETRLVQVNTDNTNLTRALAEQVQRTLKETDNILLFMKTEYEAHQTLQPETIHLLESFQRGKLINQIKLADAEGNVIYRAVETDSPILTGNREYFKIQKNNKQAGLYIGLPLYSQNTRQSYLFLSRRLEDSEGNFTGIVSLSIDPKYFSQFFEQMELGEGSSILITRKDGAALAWASRQNVMLDPRFHDHPIYQEIASGKNAGTFESPGFFSTATNLGAYQQLGEYNLVVVVSTIKETVLKDVYARRMTYYGWALIFIFLGAVFSYALWQQFNRLRMKEISLQATERDYEHLLENMSDGYYRTTTDGQIVKVNTSMTRMLDYISEEDMRGKSIQALWFNAQCGNEYLKQMEAKGSVADLSLVLRRKFGGPLPVSVSAHNYTDEQEHVLGTEGIVRNISERQKAEEQLKHLSYHDNLTNLYNRAYLNKYMKELEDCPADSVGLIVADVDGLKVVNDTLGHEAGDYLLEYTAEVLRQTFTSQVVARIGGDEFAVVMPNIAKDQMEKAVENLRIAVEEKTYESEGRTLPLQLSIGFSLEVGPEYNLRNLFSTADRMMYREKLRQAAGRRGTIIKSLKEMLSARDYITEGHASRMQKLAVALAQKAKIDTENLSDVDLFAQFHDIGKVGVPDRILNKPGPLDQEERKMMQYHAEIGHRIATASDELAPIADWILKHHERWDGQGYPLALAGEEIPLECRILAIVDAYDAMTNDRPYRKALSFDQAMIELKKCAGSQFDPLLVQQFIGIMHEPFIEGQTIVSRQI
jgi:diguanylate cyclase (GGDEF)-like protein/PAS domain S-box-containing protein